MKRFCVVTLSAVVLSLATAGSAAAQPAGPCDDFGDPGNSDYARHHIVALAQEGALGHDGHVPGSHHGYSLCIG